MKIGKVNIYFDIAISMSILYLKFIDFTKIIEINFDYPVIIPKQLFDI